MKRQKEEQREEQEERWILFIGVSSINADGEFYCYKTQATADFTPALLAQLNGSKPFQRFHEFCVPGCNANGSFRGDVWQHFKTRELPLFDERHVTVVGFMDS